jgi:hypothetical protein
MRALSKSPLALLASIALVSASSASGQVEPLAKDVAAPPADITSGRVVLPRPAETAVASPVQIRPLVATRDRSGWSCASTIVVDRAGPLALVALSPRFVDWSWDIVDPSGATLDLDALRARGLARRDARDAVDPGSTWSGDRIDLDLATPGAWRVRLVSPVAAIPPPESWLVARTAGEARIEVYASTLEMRSDVEIGVVARFEGAPTLRRVRGTAVAELATGRIALDLHDDGQHADGAANDGTFGAWLPRWTSGAVRVRVDLSGDAEDGAVVARSAQIAFPVIERRVALTGGIRT